MKLPDKLKGRLLKKNYSSGESSEKKSSSSGAGGSSSPGALAAAAAAQQQQALMAAASGLDPFTASLLTGGAGAGLDAATMAQLQMHMMLQNPMLGLGAFGLPPSAFSFAGYPVASSAASSFSASLTPAPSTTTTTTAMTKHYSSTKTVSCRRSHNPSLGLGTCVDLHPDKKHH